MSSFRDLVKRANEEKKNGSVYGQSQSTEEEDEKKKSFRDLVRNVNNGTIKVGSTLNSSQVNDWFSGVTKAGQDGYSYLSKEGYKAPNTELTEKIDTYLAQAENVGQYLRANKSAYDNYDELYRGYSDTVSYLRSLQSGVKSSNDFFSKFESEYDYTSAVEQAKADAERWAALTGGYDPTKHQAIGKAGWEDYLATQSRISQREEEARKAAAEKPWYEKMIGYLGDIGPDTSLPVIDTRQISQGYLSQELKKQKPDERWSDEQRETFGYLWNTERQKAYEYAYAVNNRLNIEAERLEIENIQGAATDNFWAGAANTVGAIATAPLGLADYLGDVIAQGTLGYVPDSDGVLTPFEYSQAVTGGISEHLNEYGVLDESIPIIGGKGWGDAYGLGTSIAQSTVAAYSGGQAQALISFFGSAAASGVDDAINRGASGEQAMIYGTSVGAFEALAEMIGIDNLLKIGSSATVKELLINLLKQSGAEALEEGLTSLLNNVADNIVMADKSNFYLSVEAYKRAGMSEEEAKHKAWTSMSNDMLYDMLGGFVSGGVHAGPQTAYQTYQTNAVPGKSIMQAEGGVEALQNLANEIAGVSDPQMQATLAKQAGKVSTETATGKGIVGKTVAAVKNASNATKVGRLYNTVQNANNLANASANQADIAKSLVRKGFTEGTANDIASAIVARDNGQSLTRAQEKLLKSVKDSKVVQDAISNIVTNEQSTMGQRSQNIRNFESDISRGIISKAYTAAMEAAKEKAKSVPTTPESAVGGSYEVSTEGKTVLDGKEVKLDGFRKMDDGSVVVVTADGQTAEGGDITYANKGQAVVYEGYASIETTAGNPVVASMDIATRSALAKAYDPASGVDGETYFRGANQAFWYGFEGISMDEKTLPQNSFVRSISKEQRAFAYELGRKAGEHMAKTQDAGIQAAYEKAVEKLGGKDAAAAVAKKTKGKVILEDGIRKTSMTPKQKAAFDMAGIVAEAVSTKVHVYHGVKEYGKYDPTTGEIWLNINGSFKGSSMMAFTLSHELVHMAKQWKPAEFKAFADYLLEQYGKKGVSVESLIQAQIDNAKLNDYVLDEHAAYEEVIADSCMRMLLDSDALQKMSAYKEKNPSQWQKIVNAIKEFINKVRKLFEGADPDAMESDIYKSLDQDAKQYLEKLFVDMVMDAGEHMSTIRNAFGEGTVVEVNADGEFTLAKGEDADGAKKFLYNDYTWENGGRETLAAALKAEGYSDADIKAALTIMDGKHEMVKNLAEQFPEQSRINQVTVTTDLKDGHSVLSALVSNGDYPVNIDLLMVCKKRKAYQRVINRLCETGLIQQATVDALAIAEINKILGKYGFETACLGCFVESRRLRIQEWAETIVKEWNGEVKKRNPNAKAFGFGKGEAKLTADEVMQLIGELESGGPKNDKGNLNLGQGSAVKRMGVLLDKVPSLRKTLSVEDLITPDGLTALRKFDSNLFSMVKSRYGSNSPKFVQEFNPYNHELAMYGKVPSEYKSLREYLYAIGGARMQSFSDFIVENWFDYCQIVADLAARKLPMHTYTKEISLAKLFGLTGIKINMSLIPDIDRSLGKEFAGLTRNADGELELIWADKDRFKATGGKSYMQSINFADAIALQNDPRYSANVGTIAVGVSDNHILMMLDDSRIRMIIPYHSSGMNPIFADLMGTSFYKDYTMSQNTTVKQLYNSKGQPVSVKLDKTQVGTLTSGFQFNAVLQELGDARAAAQAYMDWCADASKHTITIKGETYTAELTPKFDEFSWHENYYKLLEDFNTYDCISEEAAPQGDVQQVYPESFDDILTAELSAQEGHRQKQEKNNAFDKAMGEIEEYLSTHTKADTVFYAEQHGVKISAKDKKLDAEGKRKLAELRKGMKNSLPKVDSAGKQLSDDQVEYFENSQVRNRNGNLQVVYHGGTVEFEFDTTRGGKGATQYGPGAYFTDSEYYAKEYTWYRGGDVKDYYLNIEKMFDDTNMDATVQMPQWKKLEQILRSNGIGDKFINKFKENGFAYMSRYLALKAEGGAKTSSSWEGSEQLNAMLREAGFDGIKGDLNDVYQYVIFTPNQAKLTSNEVPSSFYDTRYSMPKANGDSTSYKEPAYEEWDVQTALYDAMDHRDMGDDNLIKVGKLPRYISDKLGIDGDFYIYRNHAYENMVTVEQAKAEGRFNKKKHYHGLGVGTMTDAVMALENPIMTIATKTKEGNPAVIMLLPVEGKNKAPLYAVLSFYSDRKNNGDYSTRPHIVLTIAERDFFGSESRNGYAEVVGQAVKDKRVIDFNKKMRGTLSVIANQARVGDITDASLAESLAHFLKEIKSFKEKNRIFYKTPNSRGMSSRQLLADAFDELVQTPEERKLMDQYRANISMVEGVQERLTKLRGEISRLTKAKGDKAKIAELNKTAAEMAELIDKYDRELLKLEASKPLRDVLARARSAAYQEAKRRSEENLKEYRQQVSERFARGVEGRRKTALRHKIRNFKKKLESMLLRPTDRQYIPIDLINAMVDVCTLIDTDTDIIKADGSINKAQEKRNLTKEKLQNLKDEYEKLKTHSDPIYAGEFDEMVYAYLTELRDKFSGKHLNEMSFDDLTEMYEILVAIDETLRDARKLIGWGDAENVYEAGDAIVDEQRRITEGRKNGKRSWFGKANDGALNLSLAPMRNVERMSGYNGDSYLLKLFRKFELGIRKKNMFVMQAYKDFESFTSGREYDDAVYKEVGGKKYTDIKGRKFGISKMQMMQAILSYEREQANNHLHHIETGGFNFADLDMLSKGRVKDATSEEYSHRVPNAVGLVSEFVEILKDDKWCQDYMEAARKFFNGKAKDAINETTIILKHRIVAKDKSYIPFESDRNFVNMEISAENNIQQTINSYGMLKDTKTNAPQPLIITGLNNVLDRHIEMVGNVYGLAVEVRNFNKVWNVRSLDEAGDDSTVKAKIQENWGMDGVKHIEQSVQDIQGPRVRERNILTGLYDKVKSGYISATFLLNLSVVTKQIGSLFSSTSMLRWRDPVSQIGNLVYTMINHKKISAEVDKYTASAWMRRQGVSDAELNTLMTERKKSWLGRQTAKMPALINPTKWITAMDHAVALSLWRYAKIDTAKRTGLKGEELLKATAEFYDDVIENTQSMTDILHRPEIQKQHNPISEAFAMFKTDLYQMAGQLHVTAGRYMTNKSKENGKALGRTLYAVAMSAVWGQLMTTVFALLRYKVKQYRDEEDEELTAESWLSRQGFALVGDLMGYIIPILGSETVGIFENIKYGESEDIVDNFVITLINDLYDAMITIGTSVKDKEMPNPADMKKIATKALQAFGVPASNILRTWEAIQLHANDIANGEFLSFEAGVERSPKHHIHRIIEAVDEGNLSVAKGLYEEALEEIATKKADGGEYGDDEIKEAKSSLKSALSDKYKDGEVTKDIVTEILSQLLEMDADEIYWAFDKWDYAQENGSSDDYAQYGDFYTAVQTGKDLKAVIKEYTDHGIKNETLAGRITSYFKPLYKEMTNAERAAIKGYLLNAYELLGYKRYEKSKDIDKWLND